MKMRLLVALLLLSGCATGIDSGSIQPAKADFEKELPETFKLKGKVELGEVTSVYETNKWLMTNDKMTPEAFKGALNRMLGQAKILSRGKGKYILTARIMDYRYPSMGMMHVTAGAAVAYRVVEADTEKEVYSKTITSAFEKKKGLFADAQPTKIQATATAFAENAVQLARELADIVPVDKNDTSTIPLNKLKGAVK